ncbi:hypothetical protein HanIR_Chr08g0356841 [Helianthus annuus]|nr:hypothetical protein HanIR_Chr08g0356841 [Helianthus annuus]KAJ0718550.1 hypothetical protein HanLR1_Chr08g0271831 [Helianthus annuus]
MVWGSEIGGKSPKKGRRAGGEREERERSGPMKSFLFFFFNKKPNHLREECRHQFKVLGEFKMGVDMAHEDWLCVREGTPLLGECPLHPKSTFTFYF